MTKYVLILLWICGNLQGADIASKENCMKEITIFLNDRIGTYKVPLMVALNNYQIMITKSASSNIFTSSIKLYSNTYNSKNCSPCTRAKKFDQSSINHLLNGDFYHIEFTGLHYLFFGPEAALNACRHFIAKIYNSKKLDVSIEKNIQSLNDISPECYKLHKFPDVTAPLAYLLYRSLVKHDSKTTLNYNVHPEYLCTPKTRVHMEWLEKNNENNIQKSYYQPSRNLNIQQFIKGNFTPTFESTTHFYKDTGDRLSLIGFRLFIGANKQDVALHFAQQLMDPIPDANKND